MAGQAAPVSFKPLMQLGPHFGTLQQMATMELKAGLAILLSHFSFALHESMGGWKGAQTREQLALTLTFAGGIKMMLTPRPLWLSQHAQA